MPGSMPGNKPARQIEPRRFSDWLRLILPLVIIAALIVVAWQRGYFELQKTGQLNHAADQVRGIPWLEPIFVAIYAAAAAFAAPVSPMAYGAGALFGVIQGTLLVWTASVIGAAGGYWLARGVWADAAKRLLGQHQDKMRDLRDGNTFLLTLRTQLLPIVPFGVFNYAAGAMQIPFLSFIAGTALGILPGTVAAVYVGERVAAGFRGAGRTAFFVAAGVMLALIGISFLPALISKLRER